MARPTPKNRKATPARKAARPAPKTGVAVLVGTRKGLWILRTDARRKAWKLDGPHFLGHVIHHAVLDPRDRKTLLVAAQTGHLGPTMYRSTSFGRTWEELTAQPPKFPRGATYPGAPDKPRAVERIFALEPGAPGQPGVWYAGTSPAALFRSEDHGSTWAPVSGFNDAPLHATWFPAGTEPGSGGVPEVGQPLHSIVIDPRDPRRMYIAVSPGGIFATDDGGETWRPMNKGVAADFAPKEVAEKMEFGHDPHCIRLSANPDRIYQQNHCGIYRIDRPSDTWDRIGNSMPRSIGDIGFGIVPHPRNADVAWVFPMDGSAVWPRVSPGGKPAVFRTRNAGKSWQRQDKGMPPAQAWYTVKRQAFTADSSDPAGLYFGTTSGDVWASTDEGDSWRCIVRYLPHIFSVTAAETRA